MQSRIDQEKSRADLNEQNQIGITAKYAPVLALEDFTNRIKTIDVWATWHRASLRFPTQYITCLRREKDKAV
ncbi:hypothetical protein HZS_2617 [Henneguya salminicola]|nr:hypothetical protein HZS_2617 [Henneguya salminicola]